MSKKDPDLLSAEETVGQRARTQRRRWFPLALLLFVGGSVGATVVFRSAIPFGSASSWSSATGGDPAATQGLWVLNSDGKPYAHTTTGQDYPVGLARPMPIAVATFDGLEDSVTVTYSGLNSTSPKLLLGAPIMLDTAGNNGSGPAIGILGNPTQTSCVVGTSGRFTGQVYVYALAF